jgi:hypothetical protein
MPVRSGEPETGCVPDWDVSAATQKGASHTTSGAPNQDAHSWRVLEGGCVAVAIADGHGHWRHYRADRGSRFAVESACASATELRSQFEALSTNEEAEAFATATLVPAIVNRWNAAVLFDWNTTPLSVSEEALRSASRDDTYVAYGSTLLLAFLSPRWVLAVQIGDGDVVALQPDGGVILPVPDDPSLVGSYTTSLCQAAAATAFRVGLIDRSRTPILGLVLASDGYANAQASDPWQPAVGRDIVRWLRLHGPRWVAEQLPEWVSRCASSDGSGDDTTVVLAIART